MPRSTSICMPYKQTSTLSVRLFSAGPCRREARSRANALLEARDAQLDTLGLFLRLQHHGQPQNSKRAQSCLEKAAKKKGAKPLRSLSESLARRALASRWPRRGPAQAAGHLLRAAPPSASRLGQVLLWVFRRAGSDTEWHAVRHCIRGGWSRRVGGCGEVGCRE